MVIIANQKLKQNYSTVAIVLMESGFKVDFCSRRLGTDSLRSQLRTQMYVRMGLDSASPRSWK
jgi:hypothetical protein